MAKRLSRVEINQRLYRWLVKGKTQTVFCKTYGYDKGFISRLTNMFLESGYIACINQKDRVHFYEATKKRFLRDDAVILSTIQRDKTLQRSLHRYELIKIEKCRFSCPIVVCREKSMVQGKKTNLFSWDESRTMGNRDSVLVQQFEYPFRDLGGSSVVFQRYRGVNTGSDVLIIILPRLLWNKKNGDPESYLVESAKKAKVWFAKKFRMTLGENLEWCQRPAYCAMLTDPKLIAMAQTGSYSNVHGFDLNSSPPDRQPELESKSWGDLEELTELPVRVRQLEGDIVELKNMVRDLTVSVQSLVHVFDSPKRPDDRRDVEWG
jgi:hypothetical protein